MPTRAAKSHRAGGFRNIGEFVQCLARAEHGEVDSRLRYPTRAASGANENDPSGGGFLVAATFVDEILRLLYSDDVVGRCWLLNPDAPLAYVRLPVPEETNRGDGSRFGGIVSAWLSEGDQSTVSSLKFRMNRFSANKIIAVIGLTEELLSDAAMLTAFLNRAVPQELLFRQTDKIVRGSGAGSPLGIINAPATITVDPDAGQAAATITPANVRKMWRRLPAPSRLQACWLVHEDADEQLEQLFEQIGTGAVNSGMYQPAGTNGSTYPLLKGRPVISVEQASPLGQKGDLILADLSQYAMVHGNLASALSAHVKFLSDEILLRFILRCDGSPAWAEPITPYTGSTTRSPFVVLGDRTG